MSAPSQGWRVLLSHHRPRDLHRCYRLGRKDRSIHLCARCLGLYPVLLAVVTVEATWGQLLLEWRWLVGTGLVIPALLDWSGSMLFGAEGTNLRRLLTGGLAGAGLGLAFGDYLKDTSCFWFWALVVTLGLLVGLIWWVRPVEESIP